LGIFWFGGAVQPTSLLPLDLPPHVTKEYSSNRSLIFAYCIQIDTTIVRLLYEVKAALHCKIPKSGHFYADPELSFVSPNPPCSASQSLPTTLPSNTKRVPEQPPWRSCSFPTWFCFLMIPLEKNCHSAMFVKA